MRGLKSVIGAVVVALGASHPIRVRGLKLFGAHGTLFDISSHSIRVRGLKFQQVNQIALRTQSRTPYGCVD